MSTEVTIRGPKTGPLDIASESATGPGGLVRFRGGSYCDDQWCGAKVPWLVCDNGHLNPMSDECGTPECPSGGGAWKRERMKGAVPEFLDYWQDGVDTKMLLEGGGPGRELVTTPLGEAGIRIGEWGGEGELHETLILGNLEGDMDFKEVEPYNNNRKLARIEVIPPWGLIEKSPDGLYDLQGLAQEKVKSELNVSAGCSVRDGWGFDEDSSEDYWWPTIHMVVFVPPTGLNCSSDGWRVREVDSIEYSESTLEEKANWIFQQIDSILERATFRPQSDGGRVGDRFRFFGDLQSYSSDPGEDIEEVVEEAYNEYYDMTPVEEKECEIKSSCEADVFGVWKDDGLLKEKVGEWAFETWRRVKAARDWAKDNRKPPPEFVGTGARLDQDKELAEWRDIGEVLDRMVSKEVELSQWAANQWFKYWVYKLADDFDEGAIPESVLKSVCEAYEIPSERLEGRDGLIAKNAQYGRIVHTTVDGEKCWVPT